MTRTGMYLTIPIISVAIVNTHVKIANGHVTIACLEAKNGQLEYLSTSFYMHIVALYSYINAQKPYT